MENPIEQLSSEDVLKRYSLVSGSGDAAFALNSFDRALQSAGVGNLNLVKVTSILPPGVIPGNRAELPDGAVVYAAIGSITSDRKDDLLSASVAVGIPADRNAPGVIMEGGAKGSADVLEKEVRAMAWQALKDRGLEVAEIKSVSVEHKVRNKGTALTAVLLW